MHWTLFIHFRKLHFAFETINLFSLSSESSNSEKCKKNFHKISFIASRSEIIKTVFELPVSIERRDINVQHHYNHGNITRTQTHIRITTAWFFLLLLEYFFNSSFLAIFFASFLPQFVKIFNNFDRFREFQRFKARFWWFSVRISSENFGVLFESERKIGNYREKRPFALFHTEIWAKFFLSTSWIKSIKKFPHLSVSFRELFNLFFTFLWFFLFISLKNFFLLRLNLCLRPKSRVYSIPLTKHNWA